MTWPDAVYQSIQALCWTFVAWRCGSALYRYWRDE